VSDMNGYLTRPLRSLSRREPLRRVSSRRTIYWGVLCLAVLNPSPALGVNKDHTNSYKLYAHIKIVNAKEYRCLEILWDKESRWNPRADNPKSTAFGIPQLLKLKATDPYVQIDLGLKYIKARHLTPCKALAFHRLTGHY
jgi:hypothetical protein